MQQIKIITQYTDKNLEREVNRFLSNLPLGSEVVNIQYSGQEDFFTAMIVFIPTDDRPL